MTKKGMELLAVFVWFCIVFIACLFLIIKEMQRMTEQRERPEWDEVDDDDDEYEEEREEEE